MCPQTVFHLDGYCFVWFDEDDEESSRCSHNRMVLAFVLDNVFKSCCTPDRFLLNVAKSVSAEPNSDLCKNNPDSSLLRTWDVFLFAYFKILFFFDTQKYITPKPVSIHKHLFFLQYNLSFKGSWLDMKGSFGSKSLVKMLNVFMLLTLLNYIECAIPLNVTKASLA